MLDHPPEKNKVIKTRYLILGCCSLIVLTTTFIYLESYHSHRDQLRINQSKLQNSVSTSPKMKLFEASPYEAQSAPGNSDKLNGSQKINQILDDIRQIEAQTPSKEHYALFLRLKNALNASPALINRLRDFPLFEEPKTEAQKKQISLIYGALAQCGRPEAWPILKEALEKGQGEIIGFQAVSAVADFGPLAPVEAVDSLLQVVKTHPENYIRNSAFLALGSIAQGQKEISDRVRPIIKERLLSAHPSQPWYDVDVTLAAAGNHGDPSYIEPIKTLFLHSDETIRGRVLFALRRVPQQERDAQVTREMIQWIAQRAKQDTSPKVQIEALKALSEQDLKLENVSSPVINLDDEGSNVGHAMAQIAVNARSKEVLQTAIRLLSHRLLYFPEATSKVLVDLKANIKDPQELAMINEHLKKHSETSKSY